MRNIDSDQKSNQEVIRKLNSYRFNTEIGKIDSFRESLVGSRSLKSIHKSSIYQSDKIESIHLLASIKVDITKL